MMPKPRVFLFLALLATCFWSTAQAQVREGVALVIGNESYSDLPEVGGATADAAGVGVYLRQAGFDVEQHVNLTQGEMLAATLRFLGQLRPGEVAVVYFSGHILQYDGANFLVPVDVRLTSSASLLSSGLALNTLINRIEATEQSSAILFLEGGLRVDPTGDGALSNGMAEPPESSVPMAVAMAVAPNETIAAADPTLGDFTASILDQATRPGVSLRDAMALARDAMARVRGNAPLPWVRDTLDEPYMLTHEDGSQAETVAMEHGWEAVLAVSDDAERLAAVTAFLESFPDSEHADEALAMQTALQADMTEEATEIEGAVLPNDDPDPATEQTVEENRPPEFAPPSAIVVTAGAESMPINLPAPADPDGDPLTVTVTTVPDWLNLSLDDVSLAVGDSLPADRIGDLMLAAGADAQTGDVLTLEVTDPSSASASASIRFAVEARENHPPIAATLTPLSVAANAAPVNLAIPAPEDPDGDTLTLTVTSVPKFGQLRIGDTAARLNQVLTVEELATMTYAPPIGQSGEAGTVTIAVSDSFGGEARFSLPITVSPAPTTQGAAAWDGSNDNSEDVRRAQRALQAVGLYRGILDGIDGPGTRAALLQFQNSIDADATGDLTLRQRAELAVAGAEAVAAEARDIAAQAEEAATRAEAAAASEDAAEETFVLGVYRGEVQGNTVEGYGVLQAGNGQRFAGLFENNEPQLGVTQFQGNSRYAGQQVNGLPHGLGVYEYATGVVFAGEWAEGRIQGLGVSEAALGVTVAGEWAGNAPIGYGSVTDPTNGRRVGMMGEGRIIEVY